MWFKQIQLFQMTPEKVYSPQVLADELEPLKFTPCLPSLPSSLGWISPLDNEDEEDNENASLVRSVNGNIMICLQFEERILPASVIRQALKEKVKKIEARDGRKVRSKEKLSLKDEVITTLLPRSFTKLTQIYAYLDTKHNWLILNTTNAAKTEQFLSFLNKTFKGEIRPFDLKNTSPIFTHWLANQSNPTQFSIEKSCMLQDPSQQNRIIRCQQQNLFANSVQSFIKEGCEVKQLALCWQDRIHFTLADNFSIRSVQYQDEIIAQADELDIETKQQQFDADFLIMTETLALMIKDLLEVFIKAQPVSNAKTIDSKIAEPA